MVMTVTVTVVVVRMGRRRLGRVAASYRMIPRARSSWDLGPVG